MYWPSFNSAITDHGDGQHRAAINTYLALASSVLTAVGISSVTQKKGKLDMVTSNHLQSKHTLFFIGSLQHVKPLVIDRFISRMPP